MLKLGQKSRPLLQGVADALQAQAQSRAGRMPPMFFDMLAETCREIEAGLQDIRVVPGQEISGKADAVREQIMELVVARLALMCTKNNPQFDSFTFNAKARGRKS